MINSYLKYAMMFIMLVLIQILILNQVQLSGYINPYMYILFILLLPVNTPAYAMLMLAFLMGITIDIFSNSMGIHASASVFIAYVRPFVIRSVSVRDEELDNYPGLMQTKFPWFFKYTAVLVIIHHFILFYLEVFSFSGFFITFLRVLLSSIFSIFIIVLSQFIIFRK
jgi:hypothetical protein